MKQNSIVFSITSFFLISIISIIAFFSLLIFFENKKENNEQNKRVFRAIKTLHLFNKHKYSMEVLNEQLKTLELKLVSRNVVRNHKPYNTIDDMIYTRLYKINNIRYLLVVTPKKTIHVFKDLQEHTIYFPYLLIGLLCSAFVAILSYIAVIKKLLPLKELEQKVIKFGQGDLNIITKVTGNDEISRLANSFNDALINIRKLKGSRDFFIRNIMHELKTPITKGKITLELLEEDKNKERLVKVFNRLEILINELALVESIITDLRDSNKREYRIVDILDGSKDLMVNGLIDIKTINIDKNIVVDYELFCILFKNLIDNGLKYSSNKKITIQIKSGNLEFINSGKKMEKTLEEHTKPFEKTKSNGFGLGLYIVDTILNIHNYKLEYRYEDGNSIFFFRV